MSVRGKVYIIQEVMKRNHTTGCMEATMDFRKAANYGDLEVCLSNGRVSLTPWPTVNALKDKLRNFCDNDYLVAVGDPSAIAMAGAIACQANRGKFNLLKWDRDSKQYIAVAVNIYRRED